MSNLPDDWGSHWHRCRACGKKYPASGTTTCDCTPCRVCGEMHAPSEEPCVACTSCDRSYCDKNVCPSCGAEWNDCEETECPTGCNNKQEEA